MRRLHTLALAHGIDTKARNKVIATLRYFIGKVEDLDKPSADALAKVLEGSLTFEDLHSKRQSFHAKFDPDHIGYVLVMGQRALQKYELSNINSAVEVHTVHPDEWSGPFREQVIQQLQQFMRDWVGEKAERELLALQTKVSYSITEIHLDYNKYRRYIQLKVLNGRPQAVVFVDTPSPDSNIILRDATKRLKEPESGYMPIVVGPEKTHDEWQEFLLTKGYQQPFLMDIDEFMIHIRLMCASGTGERIKIILEPLYEKTEVSGAIRTKST